MPAHHTAVDALINLREQGTLYRPRTYSTGHPMHVEMPDSEGHPEVRFQHPGGEDLHAFPVDDPTTRRAGLRVVDGGSDCA